MSAAAVTGLRLHPQPPVTDGMGDHHDDIGDPGRGTYT